MASSSPARSPSVIDPADDLSDPGYDGDKDRCSKFGGAVIVAAAGNDATDAVRQYPAAEGAYGLLAVAASSADSRLASFSNFGSWIDLPPPAKASPAPFPAAATARGAAPRWPRRWSPVRRHLCSQSIPG